MTEENTPPGNPGNLLSENSENMPATKETTGEKKRHRNRITLNQKIKELEERLKQSEKRLLNIKKELNN